MNKTILKADRVGEIFKDCLFRDGEDTAEHIEAEGIMCNVGFHPQRIEMHSEEIGRMLKELPDEFQKETGGGMSFLNACMDKHGTQWGEHRSMEQLFQLGIGAGKAAYCMPRDMWDALPGGMPYCVVL